MHLKSLAGATLASLLTCTTALATSISDDKVVIGMPSDFSGIYADLTGKGSAIAAQMAIDEFGGKVLGKPIELLTGDHHLKADVAVGITREWLDRKGLDVVVDIAASSAALAVTKLMTERGKITINNAAGTTRLTGKDCSALSFHWAYDTFALANGVAKAMTLEGNDTWFFITADYAFGYSMEADAKQVIEANGGKVIGSVRHPLSGSDFSSYLLQAQASGAKVIGAANAGSDLRNTIKQAKEFGITSSGQKLTGMIFFIDDARAIGVKEAAGLSVLVGYYWNRNDESRAFAKRFEEKANKKPNTIHAGVYSATRHYLRAIESAGTDDGPTVAEHMRKLKIDDFFALNGFIREDGRMVHDMFLVKIKPAKEAESDWDVFEVVRTLPGNEAYRPLSESECALVKN
ncbi:MAG: ABC transporter substrate-binding protein [Gammaproteobacteria bacterium]|nr:ABC transporter substrate-binding protein [Gammaproteobacteria bacterium]